MLATMALRRYSISIFSYAPGTGSVWKQTTATSTDLLTNQVTTTVYNYGYVAGDVGYLNDSWIGNNQVPVEQSVLLKDGSGVLQKSVHKTWLNSFANIGTQTILDDGKPSAQGLAVQHCYDSNEQVINEYEYGFSPYDGSYPGNPTCYTNGFNSGSGQYGDPGLTSAIGPLKRQTTTVYQQFASGTHIVNAPQSVTVADSSGATGKQTRFSYDQNALQASGAINLTSPPGTAEGNITTLQKLVSGTTNFVTTTYQYYDTGQMHTMTDGCGNTSCSDVVGANHTTTYSYADNYAPGTGTPPGQTNAYLTQATLPNTGVAHTVSFSWGYNDGQIRSSTDQNSQPTSYQFNDPLARLTQIAYPDTGQTTVAYNDSTFNSSAHTPNFVVTKKITGTVSLSNTTAADGMGHVATSLIDNRSGWDGYD